MKKYKVHLKNPSGESTGYYYSFNKREAQQVQNKSNKELYVKDTIQEIEFEMNKKGIVGLLIEAGSHPDNG